MADCTPQALAAAASCLRCLPKRRPVRTFLLCQWANNLCDPDALAFILAAGLSQQSHKDAICKLVYDLKHNGSPSYWSREILIYPFVGGNATAHAVNLKTPGTNNLTYFGAPALIHSVSGVKGTNAGYAKTGYFLAAPITVNNVRAFWYQDTPASINAVYWFGCGSGSVYARSNIGADEPVFYAANQPGGGPVYVGGVGNNKNGSWVIQRNNDANNTQGAWNAGPLQTLARVAVGLSPKELWLMAFDNGSISPTDGGMSGFSLGLPLANDAEWAQYAAIWQTYQTSLGRAH